MTPRDQKLALLLIGVVTLAVGGAGGYLLVFDPIQQGRAAEAALAAEIADLEGKQRDQSLKLKRLAVQRAQSLPADQTVAKQEYFVALERLVETAIRGAEAAGVPRGEMKAAINAKVVDNTSRSVPEVTKGKPVYTKLAYTVKVEKADMWVVRDVLKGYYDLDLLHQITHFSLKKDEGTAKGPVKRNDLTLEFTSEAIIVDGPTNGPQFRRTLLAVPTAFAAAGGGALQQVLEASTELGRGASARPNPPVLATKPRDYSLIVLKDPFHGPLPPPPPYKLSPVKDVKVVQDEKPAPVKVAVSGEGAAGTKLRAIASGTLFPEGELKTDNRALTVELPKTSAEEGTAKVEVIATSADGKVEKTSFTVSVEKAVAKATGPEKDDVSGSIILTMVTYRSDGTASAAIRDGANRQRYEIEVAGKKVTVGKFYYIKDRKKEDETDRNGVLAISDDTSRTKRTFKVVAVDAEGLILEDLKPGRRRRGRGRSRAARARSARRPKQGGAEPVAAVGGNVAAAVAAGGSPKLYRWTAGQSLAAIQELSADEARKVLKLAADHGPMLDVAAAGGQ
jgi:hypothetical protein